MNKETASVKWLGHALLWDYVVTNMRTDISERILEEVQSVPQRNEEWMEVVVVGPNVHLDLKKKKNSSDFKSQRPPWMKWCPPSYQVQKGSHLLCCPLPTMPGGLVPPRQEEAWFSQSQSSRLWPVPYCHERITRSCRSPAETQRIEGMQKDTGNYNKKTVFFLIKKLT